jgi:hypothetical protein
MRVGFTEIAHNLFYFKPVKTIHYRQDTAEIARRHSNAQQPPKTLTKRTAPGPVPAVHSGPNSGSVGLVVPAAKNGPAKRVPLPWAVPDLFVIFSTVLSFDHAPFLPIPNR